MSPVPYTKRLYFAWVKVKLNLNPFNWVRVRTSTYERTIRCTTYVLKYLYLSCGSFWRTEQTIADQGWRSFMGHRHNHPFEAHQLLEQPKMLSTKDNELTFKFRFPFLLPSRWYFRHCTPRSFLVFVDTFWVGVVAAVLVETTTRFRSFPLVHLPEYWDLVCFDVAW